MKKQLYLTYDIGTTSLKTALVTELGQVLEVYTCEYSFDSPRANWAEVDSDTYWNALLCGTRAVLKITKVNPVNIAAIGFSSQGQTFVAVDSNGRPLHNTIIWLDKRASTIVSEWESGWLSRDSFRKISGYSWIPEELTVFKIAWLNEHVPETRGAWKYLCIPDYLIYRLSGATATDPTIAAMTGMFDIRSKDWNDDLLRAAGIDKSQLPEVLPSGSVAGELSEQAASQLGLRSGTPVCVGCNDQIAGAVGVGNVQPGIVSETTGTALAVVTTTNKLLDDERICVGLHAVKDMFYAMQLSNASAIVLKWFRDLCDSGASYDDFLVGVENINPGCDGLSVFPHFSGTQANSDARGAIVGLSLSHTRAHISRAIMESCCCILKQCIDAMVVSGTKIECVRSLGGAARSDLWLQMKAEILGIEIERPACTDAASLGAAMTAAWGIGQFNSISEASGAWYKPQRTFIPNPNVREEYHNVYQRYLSLENILGNAKNGEM